MDSNGYETEFGLITLTTTELLAIPGDHRNFLIAASFISNDNKFYWSMMTRSPIDANDQDIRAMQTVRWFWCSRKLASVIVEAEIALGAHCGKIPLLKKINFEKTPILSKDNRKSNFFKVANEFRNKSAYHYAHGELGKELAGFDSNANHRIFAHRQQGNSVSELGEQIYTLPTIKKITGSSDFEGFNKWCSQCSSSIMRFCNIATVEVILEHLPKKAHQMITLQINHEAETKEHRWPLFLVT